MKIMQLSKEKNSMKKKSKKHPAIITVDDFVFHVHYSQRAGYNKHTEEQLREAALAELNCKTIEKFEQVNYNPMFSSSDILASIQYEGFVDLNGVKQLIKDFKPDLVEYREQYTDPRKRYPFVFLQKEYGDADSYYYLSVISEKWTVESPAFNPQLIKEIGETKYTITPMVSYERMEEVFRLVYNKSYNEIITGEKTQSINFIMEKQIFLYKKLVDHIISFAHGHIEVWDIRSFDIDCRQLELPFKY
jgi:hypothetical protein